MVEVGVIRLLNNAPELSKWLRKSPGLKTNLPAILIEAYQDAPRIGYQRDPIDFQAISFRLNVHI
ncbi:MAG: hypothetical protein R3E08_07205 [Thiotrichaceae bacterium]